ncbi:SGNH/GDSL hydrolase family protein [Streptomyces sp. MUM 203J]|uniref:SGNH/GDSL hydrolase family protein n=1 Tax=Streptomyces sp. MUM 203J TaxID=2791990 RepID=UPI001F0497BC|nr:SGNH/GDSL hydrolase family protein [Streptomyces sp. MUM 203J]MCH0543481.1 SGNH/GDSL hydrolase family protein [Streptomyces sp. MUM 203J]
MALSGCVASPGSSNAGSPADTGSSAPEPPKPSAPLGSPPAAPSAPSGWNPRPASVAAVGDSISRAFDACTVLTDCPEASWATGSDARVNSLALRLLGAPGVAERSWNLARSGARAAELPEQMARAAGHRPGLVTVTVGANDACRPTPALMTPVADFRVSVETALARLREDSPATQVYVTSVPDLKRLWATGRDNPASHDVWRLGVCASMLAAPDDLGAAAERRRAAVRERVVAYNQALRDVCARDRRCMYDGGAVFNYRFGESQLSPWDWFHPSVDGQARLADIAYRNVTAPGTRA